MPFVFTTVDWIMFDTDFGFGPWWNTSNYWENTLNYLYMHHHVLYRYLTSDELKQIIL